MKKKWIVASAVIVLIITVVLALRFSGRLWGTQDGNGIGTTKRIVVNEAARTLLYLPLYHAVEKGYFREAGLDVNIVTGGTATNSFASMLSGESQFSVADPMYVPISRQQGGQTKVVAQVVGRIAIWGVTFDPNVRSVTAASIKGKKIATHPRPMSAFTYTTKLIQDLGLKPDTDVELITSTPGTEIVPFLNRQADFMISVEPNVSQAVAKGAHVVLSYPQLLGDQVLTGVMTREDYIRDHGDEVTAFVRALQRALDDIRSNPDGAITSARKYFPQIEEPILQAAIKRIVDDQVIPASVLISEDSWNKAIAVRVAAGDLKAPVSRQESCAVNLMQAQSP